MQGLAAFVLFFLKYQIKHTALEYLLLSTFFLLTFHARFIRTVMKSGPEIVKAGLRSFFESAADDIEKMVENLKLGKVSKGNQVRGI